MSRLLIVNADDFGLTPGVCESILHAHDGGIVTSTSALVVAPAWDRYAASLGSSGIGVGIHLCVVGEDPPLLAASEIPTLVDERGRFASSWRSFVLRSAAGRVDADDLRRELGAQAEVVIRSGVRVTHLDSHQNLHQWPQMTTVLLELAGQHGIGAARIARSSRWGPAHLGVRALARRFAARVAANGMAVPASSAGLDDAGRLDLERLLCAVDLLGRTGADSAELAAHPGLPDDPDRGRYRWGYRWSDEFDALCDPSARRAVRSAGFELGDFGDLAARRRGSGASA